MLIAESSDHSKNAFDCLRVAAASAVLFSHSYAVLGYAEPKPIGDYTLGNIAVFWSAKAGIAILILNDFSCAVRCALFPGCLSQCC